MSMPYPEHGFASDHERWEEAEARFCDQMVESLTETTRHHAEKLAQDAAAGHPVSPYAFIHAAPAFECSVRAAVWAQMAHKLRQSRICRIEMDRHPTPLEPNHG